jgi:hypothetical protein
VNRSKRDAIYNVFDWFDTAFHEGQFEAADWFISGIDPDGLDPQIVLALLTVCVWPKNRTGVEMLPSRKAFFDRSYESLRRAFGARADKLVAGLRP